MGFGHLTNQIYSPYTSKNGILFVNIHMKNLINQLNICREGEKEMDREKAEKESDRKRKKKVIARGREKERERE